jgi:hypothetical protein
LAVSLTFAVLGSWQFDVLEIGNEENDIHVQKVWLLLLEGYRLENNLADEWLLAMPLFLQFRVVQDYVHGLRGMAAGEVEDWQVAFLRQQRYIIEQDFKFPTIQWLV